MILTGPEKGLNFEVNATNFSLAFKCEFGKFRSLRNKTKKQKQHETNNCQCNLCSHFKMNQSKAIDVANVISPLLANSVKNKLNFSTVKFTFI